MERMLPQMLQLAQAQFGAGHGRRQLWWPTGGHHGHDESHPASSNAGRYTSRMTSTKLQPRIHWRRRRRRRCRDAGRSVAPAGLAHGGGPRPGQPSRCPWPTMAPASAASRRHSPGSGCRARCVILSLLSSPFTSPRPLVSDSPNLCISCSFWLSCSRVEIVAQWLSRRMLVLCVHHHTKLTFPP